MKIFDFVNQLEDISHVLLDIQYLQFQDFETESTRRNKRSLNSIEPTHYFRQVGERILDTDTFDKNFGYSVSISDDGLIVAISGMCTNSVTDEHFFRVKVFEEINDAWYPKGTKIDNTRTTAFLDDSKAHVSLSGDGTKLSVATVYVKGRINVEDSIPEGSVVVYEYGTNDDWFLSSTEYTGDAGAGATVYNGLTASLDTTGWKIAIAMRYFDGGGSTSEEDIGAVIVCTVGDSSSCKTIATGSGAHDYVGSSVMISGSAPYCVVFGSIGSDTAGNNSGSASIYCDESNNGIWTRRGAPLNGEAAKDEFGFSVAISSDSNYVAVGAWKNDRNGAWSRDDGGHVRVFKFDIDTNEYLQIGNDIDGERGGQNDGSYYVGDSSGYSLALSDKGEDNLLRVAIGAPNNDGDGDYYNGHVRLFECNANDSSPVWVQVLNDINGLATRESAGSSVAISQDGTRIIFGSPDFAGNGRGYYAGSAVVYDLAKYTAQPSNVPTQSPSSTTAPSSSPSLSAKTISSPEQEMIFEGVEELSASAINHWKSATETTISNELSDDSTLVSVEIRILNINEVPYDGRRGLQLVETIQSKRIIYEIIINRRVEVEESQYDESLKSVVSDALESEEYVAALNEDDSTGESAFANVTIKIGELVNAFQIRTNYEALDFSGNTTWCICSTSIAHGFSSGMMVVRRCNYTEKLQLWSTDSYRQLRLAAFPLNPTCVKTQSRSMFLDTCDFVDGSSIKDETKSFTFMDDDGGKLIKQTKNANEQTKISNEFYIGVQSDREFMRIRLFKNGVANDSLNKWQVVDGKFSTATESWEPIM